MAQLVKDKFGRSITTIHQLASYDDRNYHVTDHSGLEFVLKLHNGVDSKDPHLIEAQKTVLGRLDAAGIKVPVDVALGDEIDDKYLAHTCRLLHYIPGELLFDFVQRASQAQSLQVLEEMGQVLGRLDVCLRELGQLQGTLRGDCFVWNPEHFLRLSTNLGDAQPPFQESTQLQLYFEVKQEYEASVPNLASLRRSIIQMDSNDRNILVCGNDMTIGVLDFGDVCYTWTVNELATSIAYVIVGYFTLNELSQDPDVLQESTWRNRVERVSRGYQRELDLTCEERRVLWTLVLTRLMTSVYVGAHSAQKVPENSEYLLMHSQPAWRAIRAIKRANREELRVLLLHSV